MDAISSGIRKLLYSNTFFEMLVSPMSNTANWQINCYTSNDN